MHRLFLLTLSLILIACEPTYPLAYKPVFVQPVSSEKAIPTRELTFEPLPNITPQCDLTPLREYRAYRNCLIFDLNADGKPEYFVEDCHGAHSVGFALVDSTGKLLIKKSAVGEIGGDRIVILTSTHFHYADILFCSNDPGGVYGERWEFNGTHYVKRSRFSYPPEMDVKAYIEETPGVAQACWYTDGFARPPSFLQNLIKNSQTPPPS